MFRSKTAKQKSQLNQEINDIKHQLERLYNKIKENKKTLKLFMEEQQEHPHSKYIKDKIEECQALHIHYQEQKNSLRAQLNAKTLEFGRK